MCAQHKKAHANIKDTTWAETRLLGALNMGYMPGEICLFRGLRLLTHASLHGPLELLSLTDDCAQLEDAAMAGRCVEGNAGMARPQLPQNLSEISTDDEQ